MGVLLPGSKMAFANGRESNWGAQSIIQEVGCGKEVEIDVLALKNISLFFGLKHCGNKHIGSDHPDGAESSSRLFLLAGRLDDLINAFRTESVRCFLYGFFTDGSQSLRFRGSEMRVILNANPQARGVPSFSITRHRSSVSA